MTTSPTAGSSLEAARMFLHALYGNGEDATGQRVQWTLPSRRSQWWPADQVDSFAATSIATAEHTDVYFSIALLDQAAALTEARADELLVAAKENRQPRPVALDWVRGSASTALAIPGLWIEVDWIDPVHTATNLPPTREDALALVNEFELPPSVVIDSGHGLQAWWLFPELWVFDAPEERHNAQDLVVRFQATIRAKAARHGWTVDSTHDLARVLRLPGTWNRKRQPVVPVQLVSFDEARRYSPDDFELYLVDASPIWQDGADGDMPAPVAPNDLTEEQIIAWARRAHGDKFAMLWAGDWHKVKRAGAVAYKSQSDADYALIAILRFWTGGDAEKMDRLFRMSELMRGKWDERHFSGGKTYGEGTIRRSLRGEFETYTTPSPRLEISAAKRIVDPVTGEVLDEEDGFQHLPPLTKPRGRRLPPLRQPEGVVLPPLDKPRGIAIEDLLEQGA